MLREGNHQFQYFASGNSSLARRHDLEMALKKIPSYAFKAISESNTLLSDFQHWLLAPSGGPVYSNIYIPGLTTKSSINHTLLTQLTFSHLDDFHINGTDRYRGRKCARNSLTSWWCAPAIATEYRIRLPHCSSTVSEHYAKLCGLCRIPVRLMTSQVAFMLIEVSDSDNRCSAPLVYQILFILLDGH